MKHKKHLAVTETENGYDVRLSFEREQKHEGDIPYPCSDERTWVYHDVDDVVGKIHEYLRGETECPQ